MLRGAINKTTQTKSWIEQSKATTKKYPHRICIRDERGPGLFSFVSVHGMRHMSDYVANEREIEKESEG